MDLNEARPSLVPIGAVVEQLRRDYPDVSHSSLRFLEREELVTPTRTPGGHRLYAPSDIQRIRQIKEWQTQRLSLEQIRERLRTLDSVGDPGELAGAFLHQALAGDPAGARETILNASDVGLPLPVLFDEVLRPALLELGEKWARQEISVAQEKEVSETARELIAELTLRHSRSDDHARPGVVAACVAGEEHELGLRMLSGLLRARRINVHYLGAAVDSAFLVEAVKLRRPQAVLLSVTLDEHLPAVRDAIAALSQEDNQTRIIVGGQAATSQPELIERWGIELAMNDVDALVDSLLADPETFEQHHHPAAPAT